MSASPFAQREEPLNDAVEACYASLGADEFASEFLAGRALSCEAATELALSIAERIAATPVD